MTATDRAHLLRSQPSALLDLDIGQPRRDTSSTLLSWAVGMAVAGVLGFALGLSPLGTAFMAGLDWLDRVPK